jgi:hypothetical protein
VTWRFVKMTEDGTCTKCGKDTLGHLISFDSVGDDYVDPEAGDFLCFECHAKEIKR